MCLFLKKYFVLFVKILNLFLQKHKIINFNLWLIFYIKTENMNLLVAHEIL